MNDRFRRRCAHVLGAALLLGLSAGPAGAQAQGAFGLPSGDQPLPPPDTTPATPPQAPAAPFAPPVPPQAAQPPPFQPPPVQQQGRPRGGAPFLVGMWRGQSVDSGAQWNVAVSFRPDGSFLQMMARVDNGFELTLTGRYSVRPDAQGGTIFFNLLNWSPRVFCGPPAGCQPINLPPSSTVPFRALDGNDLQTPTGLFHRAG